jgi:outer membrane protein assembly factor BamB
VVDDDRVYTFGVEGRLRCHRVTDGKLLWEVDTTAKYGVVQNFFGAGSTPAIEGDLLVAQVGGSPPNSPKVHSGAVPSNGTGVVAFDKRTGQVRYEISDDLASYAAVKLATVRGRRWGFVFGRTGLLGFEPSTGRLDFAYPWRAPILESVNASTPVVVGDRVLITEAYGMGSSLMAVRPGGYEVVWKDPPRRGQSGDAELRAVRFETGEVLWSEPRLQRASLLFVDDHLVVLSEDGVLRLLRRNPEKYDPVAELTVEQGGTNLLTPPAWNAPLLAHGILYVRGKDRLVALELIPHPH